MKIFAAVLVLAAAGCAPVHSAPPPAGSASAVRLSVERVSNDAMRLTLDNGEFAPIGYNLCHSALQRRDGTAWSDAGTGDICTMQLLTLNPGADATFEKKLPGGLPAGEYRYLTSVESPVGTPQVGVASDAFSVR